jgi:O-antigen/teichoic acid export membrane protein
LSMFESVQAVSQTASTLLLAYLGFTYWSLVIGNMIGVLVGTVLCIFYSGHRFQTPHLTSIRNAVRYSSHILVSRSSWYAYSNADFLVAGRVLGPAPLGAYTLAWNIANVPVEKITAMISQVTPTFFSALQSDKAMLRRYLRGITEGIAFLTFPTALLLAVISADLVHTLLGAKWEAAIPALQLLAIYASLRSISTLLPQLLNVVGESRFGMWNGVFSAVLMPILFAIGSRWGTRGIAYGWVVGYPIITLPLYWRTLSCIHMSVSEYMTAIRAPLSGALPMVAAILLVRHVLPARLSHEPRLAIEVLTAVFTYSAILWLFHRQRLTKLCSQIGIPIKSC